MTLMPVVLLGKFPVNHLIDLFISALQVVQTNLKQIMKWTGRYMNIVSFF